MQMTSFTAHLKIMLVMGFLALNGCEDAQVEVVERDLLPSEFPADFTPPNDYLTGQKLDGWGGGFGEIIHTPIVFIHGNAHSADNWETMASYFAENGYTWNELWALSYLQSSPDVDYNSNEGNWREVDDFVDAVLNYTGADKVNIISHSLGVTIVRTWLKHSEDYNQVEHFVGIAGANHGVAFCYGDTTGLCGELGNPQSEFLNWLNGEDETPRDDIVEWITFYNGENLDMFFMESVLMNTGEYHDLRFSPMLDGALNIQFPELDHFELALSKTVYDTLETCLK